MSYTLKGSLGKKKVGGSVCVRAKRKLKFFHKKRVCQEKNCLAEAPLNYERGISHSGPVIFFPYLCICRSLKMDLKKIVCNVILLEVSILGYGTMYMTHFHCSHFLRWSYLNYIYLSRIAASVQKDRSR